MDAEAETGAEVDPYIDDSAAASEPNLTQWRYDKLLSCMNDLGRQAALEKCASPAMVMLAAQSVTHQFQLLIGKPHWYAQRQPECSPLSCCISSARSGGGGG